MRERLGAVILAAALWGGGPVSAIEPDELPEGPGRELTFYTCAACHSFNLVAQQRQDRAGWADTIAWMVEEQGMSEPEPEELELILDYLASAFGVRARTPPTLPQRPLLVEDLPEEPGRDLTFYTCAACHSFNLVAQQGQDRAGWADTIDWMVEEQGMSEPEPDELELLLDYLSRWFGPDRRFLTTLSEPEQAASSRP